MKKIDIIILEVRLSTMTDGCQITLLDILS